MLFPFFHYIYFLIDLVDDKACKAMATRLPNLKKLYLKNLENQQGLVDAQFFKNLVALKLRMF